MANVKSSGKYLWGMRVIAIPEILEDTMILYNSPDNYRVVKHIRVDPTHSKEGGEGKWKQVEK